MTLATVLSLENLCLSTPTHSLFQHISFSLMQGETLAIMGPSGIGKSMLSKAIAGFLPPEISLSGSIKINGHEVSQRSLLQRHRTERASIIFQDALKALNSIARIEEQLALALTTKQRKLQAEQKESVYALLTQLGFSQLDKLMRQYPSQLSGGQRQRICIAMAMLGNGKLLIADEPTSALDPITETDILQLFFTSLKQKHASGILITHDLCAALVCDKILVIDDQTMVAYGEPITAITQSQHPFCQQLTQLLPEHLWPLNEEG